MKNRKPGMNTRRFIIDAGSHPCGAGRAISITGDEFYHLKQVNRARRGDPVEIIDGRGSLFSGKIRGLKPHEAVVDIIKEEKTGKPPVNIIIAPSLLKQRPMSILMEKLTEMGVDEIRPVIFSRSDEKFNPPRIKKWRKVAAQSLKVNKRLWCTGIYPPVSIDQLILVSAAVKTKIVLDIAGQTSTPSLWHFPLIAVVGPPGDFTEEERERLKNSGFLSCKLNDCILKSETAAISVAAILKNALSSRDAA